jgi:hypothetical protein
MKLSLPFHLPVLALICTVLFSSCKFGKAYTYDIWLERPAHSQDLRYENDSLAISFRFHPSDIEFELYNKLDDALKINWKEISVSINGDTKRVIPSYAYTVGFPGKEPAIMVAPKSKIKDMIRTTDKVGYSDTSKAVSELNTYPIFDQNWAPYRNYILSLKGQRIIIYLPYYLRDIYCSKTFEFLIADVQPKNQ